MNDFRLIEQEKIRLGTHGENYGRLIGTGCGIPGIMASRSRCCWRLRWLWGPLFGCMLLCLRRSLGLWRWR